MLRKPASHQRASCAILQFRDLPDEAEVRLPTVQALFGISPATAWRWSASGLLPKPCRRGRITTWKVGELLAVLASRGVQS